jgi:hypothetical protein
VLAVLADAILTSTGDSGDRGADNER